jgi:hypothetical protein
MLKTNIVKLYRRLYASSGEGSENGKDSHDVMNATALHAVAAIGLLCTVTPQIWVHASAILYYLTDN